MTGTIKCFYQGTGWIVGENGEEYFLHYSELKQKDKWYKRERTVTFNAVDYGRPHKEATNVDIDVEKYRIPPYEGPHCGVGQWVKTHKPGVMMCTDCGRATEFKNADYCPHCGAAMKDGLRRTAPNAEPTGQWAVTFEGYLCSECKKTVRAPVKFCPNCGCYMHRLERRKEV